MVPLLFFEYLPETLANFNNFWRATSRRNLTQMTSFGHLTLILSLHYLMKWRNHILAIYKNEFILGSAYAGSENCQGHKIINNLLLHLHFKILR